LATALALQLGTCLSIFGRERLFIALLGSIVSVLGTKLSHRWSDGVNAGKMNPSSEIQVGPLQGFHATLSR
jgi:hypothetical protein